MLRFPLSGYIQKGLAFQQSITIFVRMACFQLSSITFWLLLTLKLTLSEGCNRAPFGDERIKKLAGSCCMFPPGFGRPEARL